MSLFIFATGSGGGVFTYFAQSNLAGKVIIFVLAICSIIAWLIMLSKWMELKDMLLRNRRFESKVSREGRMLARDPESLSKRSCPYALLTWEALTAFHRYGGKAASADSHRASLRMGHVENALQRTVAAQTVRYEARMVVLGSIVTGAPFLGLLGTVWGVMDAFGGLVGSSGATLQSLAPGVSGALLTTVAGLLVAIPAVVGYNFLLQSVKTAIVELENYASMLADRIELEAQSAALSDEGEA